MDIIKNQMASAEMLSGTFTAAVAAFVPLFVRFSLFFHLMTAFFLLPGDNVPAVLMAIQKLKSTPKLLSGWFVMKRLTATDRKSVF